MSLSDVTKSVVERLDTYRYNMPYNSNSRRSKSVAKGFINALPGAVNKPQKYDVCKGKEKMRDKLLQDDEACCAICLDNYETGEVCKGGRNGVWVDCFILLSEY